MITDDRPLSSPDASSRAPILLRRTLDSSFCSKALVDIHVSSVDAWADAMYRVPTKAISDLATCLICSGGIEYLLVDAINRVPRFRTRSIASHGFGRDQSRPYSYFFLAGVPWPGLGRLAP